PAADAVGDRHRMGAGHVAGRLLHARTQCSADVRRCLMSVSSEAAAAAANHAIEAPNARRKQVRRAGQNFEMFSWLFMRISGIVLVVLVLGHLFIMNILDGGVHRINWGFVAGRWASPFWQM